MMTAVDIDNPTALSDFDFLEFEGFVCKVDSEGFRYAYEEYRPRFLAADLKAIAADRSSMRAFYRENAPLVERWWEAVGPDRSCDLHNAHVDDTRLWGVRCTDGHIYFESSRESRDNYVEILLTNPAHTRKPAALLHRDVPAAEWSETLLTVAH
ncbi:hypothetical protein ACFVUN_34655 [Kitasatospora griseola]|uniref:hypothetical protein n=1 Tax=Kitasatospora griseola TaxID=2064 RepID=UPI0036DCCEC9